LNAGRYFIGVFNPGTAPMTVRIITTLGLALAPINEQIFTSTGAQLILDDAVTVATRTVTNNLRVASAQVGVRIDHPRVSDRDAMDAILFRLRTGCQWNALDATGICSCSSAYRRFREWIDFGVFLLFWKLGLINYDALVGIDWSWLALDGAITKAPLGGEKNRAQSHRSSQGGHKKKRPHGGTRNPHSCSRRGCQLSRHENG
jgi:transposase